MRRRVAPWLALGALVAWLAVETVEGRAPWAPEAWRHLRRVKDRAALPPLTVDMTIEQFAELPALEPLARYALLEARGVRVEGYVQRIERSLDGDLHLTLVSVPEGHPGRGARYLTAEVTPLWQRRSGWTFERLAAELRSGHGRSAPPPGGPRRARLSGWLMNDLWYQDLPAWAFDRAHRVSGWEVHPVTRIELWDEAGQRFGDLRPHTGLRTAMR